MTDEGMKKLKDLRKEYELLAKYKGGEDYIAFKVLDMAVKELSNSEIPNKCGHWVKEKKHHKDDFQEFDYWDVRCSECGARKRIGWTNIRHCPMCGAKMVEPQENEGV